MKSTFLRLIFACFALTLAVTSPAQSIDDKKIPFTFTQLPHAPLKGQARHYVSTVTLTYMEKERKEDSVYQAKLAVAEARYAKQLATYEADQKAAEEDYQKALAEYNKKSAAMKMMDKQVNNEGKPTRRTVYMPERSVPNEPHHARQLSEEALAANYIKLEGFDKDPEQAIQIDAYLLGFMPSSPSMQVSDYTVVEKGVSSTRHKYKYVYNNKHPMGVKVFSPDGKMIWEVYPKEFLNDKKAETAEFNSEYELENYWQKNKKALLEKQEDAILEANMKHLQDTLNSRFGYPVMSREATLFSVTDKKDSYKDYIAAFADANEGFLLISNADTREVGLGKLKDAAATWEEIMKESDPTNKKARIDKNVTIATRFNLAETLIWLKEYDRALIHVKMVQGLDLDKKEKKLAAGLESFIMDQKAREAANK